MTTLAKTEVIGCVGLLTLTRPERHNTMSLEMIDEMVILVDELESREDVHALVVTGEGRSFCAGAEMGQLSEADMSEFARIYEGFLRIARCVLPTVAAVNGPAVGAGLNLALACDVRIAARNARFISRFSELGFHPGGGHTWMLQRAVGPELAAAMVHFGLELDGEEAGRRHLALRCTENDRLIDEALTFAAGAAHVPRSLGMRIKQTRQAAVAVDVHADAIRLEYEAQAWSVGQGFYEDAIPAFTERRRRAKEARG